MTIRPIGLFLPLLLSAPLLAQDTHDLRVTAKKGSSVWLVQETAQEQNLSAGEQEMTTTQRMTRVLHVTVDDVAADGALTVKVTVARAFGVLDNAMLGQTSFDSADGKAAEAPVPQLQAVIDAALAAAGKSFTAKVGSNGRLIEVLDSKSLEKVSKDELRSFAEAAFGKLPPKPAAVGDKWPLEEQGGRAQLPLKMQFEGTLAKVDAQTIETTFQGSVSGSSPESEEGDAPQLKVDGGKIDGKQTISRADGFVTSATTKVDIKAVGEAMGQQLTIEMTSTTTTRRGSEADAKKATEQKKPADEAPKADAPKTSPK